MHGVCGITAPKYMRANWDENKCNFEFHNYMMIELLVPVVILLKRVGPGYYGVLNQISIAKVNGDIYENPLAVIHWAVTWVWEMILERFCSELSIINTW